MRSKFAQALQSIAKQKANPADGTALGIFQSVRLCGGTSKCCMPRQMQNAKANAKCKMQNAMANAKCKMQNAELTIPQSATPTAPFTQGSL